MVIVATHAAASADLTVQNVSRFTAGKVRGPHRIPDGKHTVMYIEGCPTVDNPTLLQSNGITQLDLPWALGGYEYGGVINQIFHGWVGDIRIVNRPLTVEEFMNAGTPRSTAV